MLKSSGLFIVFLLFTLNTEAQFIPKSFGSGFNYVGKDSSFTMCFGIRFQTLMLGSWNVQDDDFGRVGDFSSSFSLRRSRLKFDGCILSPRFTYKMEFGLTQNDMSGGNDKEHGFAPRYILDAYVDWNFYKNFSLKAGQAKLPGNRERVISSANLQLVDRSLLNTRYNIDRDIGIQLSHHFKIGKQFLVREIASFSQGEGRNISGNNIGGYDYTFRLEALPFGKFSASGDYIGAAIKRESTPKLSIGLTYDVNNNAPRSRGQNGSFIYNLDGSYAGKTLNTIFADLMFNYKGLSVMAEFANKTTSDGIAEVYDHVTDSIQIGTYYIGTGFNIQAGWMFMNNIELCARYTHINPNPTLANEQEYTFAVSKYIVGHKLKIQTDISYRQSGFDGNKSLNRGKNDLLFLRLQLDVHF